MLDGDNLRHGLNADLGFSEEDRAENVRRVGEVARLLAEAGTVSIVSLVSPYAAERDKVRAAHQEAGIPFFEVFVDTPLEECERRDPKGLYAKARAGEITNLTGVGAPYEAPTNPQLSPTPTWRPRFARYWGCWASRVLGSFAALLVRRAHPRRLLFLALAALCAALLVPVGAAAAVGPLLNFGSFGDGAGQLDNPEGLALDAEGNVYVAEYSNERISVFSPNGTFLRAFGRDVGGPGVDTCTTSCHAGAFEFPASSVAGALSNPVDVAFDAAGRLFVSDSQNSRIDVYTPDGGFRYAFGKEVSPAGADRCTTVTGCKIGDFSDEAGAFLELEGIGVSSSRVYAADAGNNRVSVSSLEGNFQFAFGKDVNPSGGDVCTLLDDCQQGSDEGLGAIDTPVDVALGPDGNLYVAYSGSTSGVAVFTQQGAYLRRFGEAGPGALDAASGLAIDSAGAVHVADRGDEAVKTFNAAGTFSTSFAAADVSRLSLDCRGAFWITAPDPSEVVRFGEPGSAAPPCLPSPPPDVPIVTVVPSNKFKFGKLVLNKKKGTATLAINVPAAGKLVLKGSGLVKSTVSATKSGDVKLAVKLKGRLKEKLAELGKAVAKAKVIFTPTGGVALTKQKSLTLKKTLG